jgi:predicted ATPase
MSRSPMFIRRLSVSGLLSFGPTGIDLPLEKLNVLIGPNGSGKSNLLEVLALLRAAPTNLAAPVKEMGGTREWLWKGPDATGLARIAAEFDFAEGELPLRHVLEITENGSRFEVADERIETTELAPKGFLGFYFYQFNRGSPILQEEDGRLRDLRRDTVKPEESILSQVRDPESYSTLNWLQEKYESIRLYRNWSFGPSAEWRREQSAHARADVLSDGGENLAVVLSKIRRSGKRELIEAARKLYDGIEDIHLTVDGGNVFLFLEESGREIPATRLSDGTLRYLSLLAILLHPDPPPLVAIEEPELGLHPDVLPHVAELLVRASERMQLVVTTHSRMLVDALSDHPSSVVVCEKVNGESRFERLDGEALRAWLEKYSLGSLWSMGELGANRW